MFATSVFVLDGGEIEAHEWKGAEEEWTQMQEEEARSGAGSDEQGMCRVGGVMTPGRGGEEAMQEGQAGEAGRRQKQVG